MNTIFGYWRCSTDAQDQERQIRSLQDAGCEVLRGDKITGTSDYADRKELSKLLEEINEGDLFICKPKEGKKAMLHRYVSASAIGRYQALNNKKIGKMMSLDIAFPRNEKKWLETLPKDIDDKIELKFYYGHLFCHVFHHNYILKKGVDSKKLKEELLALYDQRNAEYPAEHNTGHEYVAKPVLTEFYKKLDPTNFFNPGLGRTSKLKNWK